MIDPTQRITWPQILAHPFVEGNILKLDEAIPESPFTHPMSDTERFAKEKQAAQLLSNKTENSGAATVLDSFNELSIEPKQHEENLQSSRDSINAILQSDIEQIETDFEEGGASMLVRRQPIDGDATSKKSENESVKIQEEIEGTNKLTPTLLHCWSSCEDTQNPPIENEEWLVFIHKTMQEVLNGDFDSLKQQNFVSILVAPLRNSKASAKVIENVAQLFMLPLVMVESESIIQEIKTVS